MAYQTNDIAALIQEVVSKSLTKPLEASSTFLTLGPTIVDSAVPVRFPMLSGGFAAGWVGESEEIPVLDGPAFDDLTLLPSTMKSIKTITKLSEESLRQSSLALDSILSARLVADVERVLDQQAWSSAGDGVTTPKGVLHASNVAGFQKLDLAGEKMTLNTLHDAVGVALSENIPLGGLVWVMHPDTLTALRKVRDFSNNYIVNSDVTQAGGFTLLGIRVIVTKRLAPSADGSNLLLMTPSSWTVVRDLSPQVQVLSELYKGTGEIGLKVDSRWDWGTTQPEANVLVTNYDGVGPAPE